ncbi:hypothetical protein [Duganella sp. Root198D2]|uniref:hypothetical protein n=1 Tax=Duganella sp. Root198D2 TaxID=1736489 RepID=UPI0007107B5B|nr:hypothetical protein [Duganella sp. Root198D2]KRC03308.1 hypothetical protein ASE26_00215 [Duganella sp. Root198D2]
MKCFPKLRKLAAVAALIALPQYAFSSGFDGFTYNLYANELMVAPGALPKYAAGNLGVLSSSYWRVYLYLAYQAAKGRAITPAQAASLKVSGWHLGDHYRAWDYVGNAERNGSADWFKARAPLAVQAGLPAEAKVVITGSEDWSNYVNCHADAFRRAAVSAKARAQLGPGGKPDQWFKAWLEGQDAVFANCGAQSAPSQAVLPPAIPDDAPAWLKADRAYQEAAANFYSGNLDAARRQFLAVAQDTNSPWQPLGAYLAARCLIRSATLQGEGASDSRVAKFKQAREELAALAPSYAPARQMMLLVDARLDPAAQVKLLAHRLEQEPFTADTPGMLSDYLLLLDKLPRNEMIGAKEPLTAWIGTMQGNSFDWYDGSDNPEVIERRKLALDATRQHWQKHGDALWLAPLLTFARPGELSEAEKKAAAAVPAGHPLYQTMQYNLVRLAVSENQLAQADRDIDRLLASQGKAMSVATTNRFLALKMLTTGSLEGFVKAGRRVQDPVERGAPIDDGAKDPEGTDDDFRVAVYRHLPLASLKTLYANPDLLPAWKVELREAIFTRALVANDEASALSLLDSVAEGRNTTAHLYARYRKAASGADRKLAAALILVNTPELRPHVFTQAGLGNDGSCRPVNIGERPAPAPRFLGKEQRAEGEREQQGLRQLSLRSMFLAPTLMAWASAKPNDVEAPKALHLLLASMRNECAWAPTAEGPTPAQWELRNKYSKQAFAMLHKLYPSSDWAKKTKYYY